MTDRPRPGQAARGKGPVYHDLPYEKAVRSRATGASRC